jgi:MoxR-like ATPase
MCIDMGYPSEAEELRIMLMHRGNHPMDTLEAVAHPEQIVELQHRVAEIPVEESVARYITALVRATREHPEVNLGSSPRGSIALMKAAQAVAMIGGIQGFVTPHHVKQVGVPVLADRLTTYHLMKGVPFRCGVGANLFAPTPGDPTASGSLERRRPPVPFFKGENERLTS